MQWFEVLARPRRNLVALGSALMLGLSSAAVAAPLVVDQQASSVGVTFTQMNVPVDAQFTRFDAQTEYDPANPAAATATITIDTASFDFGPGAEEYNEEVRKDEWFAADKHPKAVFKASGATALGDNRLEVPGELTIKGVTQAVTAPVSVSQEEGRFVFVGEVPIKRLAFGIGAGEWKDTSLVADAVIVKFKIVATQP